MEDFQDNIPEETTRFKDSVSPAAKIKVVGVGGGGCNALNYMYHQNIPFVSYAAINTDRLHLDKIIDVPTKLVLGPGLGAGDKPEKGKQYAEESRDAIKALFDDETEMVFITAGMGGGTGTGAGPVVAQIAKEANLLTIGIITIPFLFEGNRKINKALIGAEEMKKHVDALLIINNQNLIEIYKDLTLQNAFKKADDTLANAARSISEIISEECYIDVDMEDVRTTLQNSGTAIIATAYGEGEHRISKAIENALHSPLLKLHDIMTAQRVLIKLSHASEDDTDNPVRIDEINELTEFTSRLSENFDVKWGVGLNPELGNKVKITLLATGFDVTLKDQTPGSGAIRMDGGTDDTDVFETETATTSAPNKTEETIRDIYTPESMYKQRRMLAASKYAIFKPSQFDDDEVIALVEHTPAFNRDTHFKDNFKALSDAEKSVKTTAMPADEVSDEAPANDNKDNANRILFG
jgi:cell division protein FtsZ